MAGRWYNEKSTRAGGTRAAGVWVGIKKRAFRLLLHIDPWVSSGTAEGDFHERLTAEVAEGFPAEDLAVFGVVDVVGVFNEHFCIHFVFSFLVCFYN